jgi:hypothetical protein
MITLTAKNHTIYGAAVTGILASFNIDMKELKTTKLKLMHHNIYTIHI